MTNTVIVVKRASTWEGVVIATIAAAVTMFAVQLRADKEYEAAKRKCEAEYRTTCHLVWDPAK